MTTRDWNAASYDRVSTPQVEMARPVLGRLPLEGHETVLDAGCGSGRVTELVLDRVPAGGVVAVDAAPSMVEQALSVVDRAVCGAPVYEATYEPTIESARWLVTTLEDEMATHD